MSQYLYEESLIEELQKVTGDGRIHIVPPENSILFLAQISKDKTKYPAIVLSRGPTTIREEKNQYKALKGETVKINEDSTVKKVKLIDMRFQWNIDIFAVDRFTCDEIVRELVFFFTVHPRFLVTIPYGLNIKQNFDIILANDIEDNSDLVEFPNKGEFFRNTLTIYTENGHFFSSRDQMTTYTKSDVDTNN